MVVEGRERKVECIRLQLKSAAEARLITARRPRATSAAAATQQLITPTDPARLAPMHAIDSEVMVGNSYP